MKRICLIGFLFLLNTAASGQVWTDGPTMPERCGDPVAEAHGTDIYVFGGWNPGNMFLATVQKFDTLSERWSLLPPMAVGRMSAASVIVGDRIYILGGLVSGYQSSADVLVFDALSQTWGTAPSLPVPLVGAAAVYADNRIWVIGGAPSWSTGDATATVYLSNDLVASGGVITAWTTHPQALPAPVVSHQAEVVQGIIYVTGGTDNIEAGVGATTDRIYALDPAVGSWVQAATLPGPVSSHASASGGEHLFTFGGYNHPDYLAGTSVFHQPTSRVDSGTPVARPTLGMRAVTVGGLIYVIGGYDELYWEGSNECRIYDPVADGFWDPFPFDGNPCPDILGIYFDDSAGSNCLSLGGFEARFSAYVVITNPTGGLVTGVEFGYHVTNTYTICGRVRELLPPEAYNIVDSSDWASGDYVLGIPYPFVGDGRSVVCVSWDFEVWSLLGEGEIAFYLAPSNPETLLDGYPAYTDGYHVFPLGFASGGADVPVAAVNGPCLAPATVAIAAQPGGLNAPWSLDVPGTPNDLTGTGDAVFEDLPAGAYTITWGDVVGYRSPAAETETLDVPPGGATTFTGTYSEIISGVPDLRQPLVSLHQNVPNPFNPSTRLSFELVKAGPTRLGIYDAMGRLVRTLVDGQFAEGSHDVTWDGKDDRGMATPAGVYLYRLEHGGVTETRRMVLLK